MQRRPFCSTAPRGSAPAGLPVRITFPLSTKAISFTSSADLQPQELAAYRTSYVWLDQRITAFWQALPPVYAFYGNSAAARTLALTHALTAAAAIRLHSSPAATDAEAQAKCLFAARAILDVLGDARVGDQAMVHPVVGALCTLSCRILMEEVRRVQAFRTAWAVGGPEKAALLTELHLGMTTMAVYAAECPLVGQFPPALACDAVLTVPQSTSYTSFGSISKQYRRRVGRFQTTPRQLLS
jgi:hypothetical protein